ncbi:MAG: hypothetical protein GY854_31935 [Deltaproteobacteria bacterium]|nr:hypothetical protein [Deltaproteobacteria bacterium]
MVFPFVQTRHTTLNFRLGEIKKPHTVVEVRGLDSLAFHGYRCPHLPVIITTTATDTGRPEQSLENGAPATEVPPDTALAVDLRAPIISRLLLAVFVPLPI